MNHFRYGIAFFLIFILLHLTIIPKSKGELLKATFNQKNSPLQQPAASHFFTSLINAIDGVEGRLVVDFFGGTTITHINSSQPTALTDVKWFIPAGTKGDLRIDYKGGKLAGINTIEFSSDIVITPQPTIPGSTPHSIRRIEFDQQGVPSKYINNFGQVDLGLTPSQNYPGFPPLQEQLKFTRDLPDAFKGVIFATLNPQFASPPTPLPLIKRIGFEKGPISPGGSPKPGLKITFKNESALLFSQGTPANPYNNIITLQSPSSAEFDKIFYNIQDKSVDGDLASIELNIASGTVSSNGINFKLQKGTSISFKNIHFHHDEQNNDQIIGIGNSLTAGLGIGSKISFSPDSPNPSWVTFNEGSKISFRTFELDITNQKTEITLANGSSISVQIADGRLSLGRNNYLFLRDGILVADLSSGKWSNETNPQLVGKINFFTADIYAGSFQVGQPNIGTLALLKGGTVRASELSLDISKAIPVTGNFSSFVLDLQDGAIFGLENRFTAICREGGRITAGDPQNPLKISNSNHPITGSLIATIPFRKISTFNPEGPVIRNGHLRSTIKIDSLGNITADNVFIDGQAKLSAPLFNKKVEVFVDVFIENGSWKLSSTNEPVLEASLKAKIYSFDIDFSFKFPECPLYGVFRMDEIHRGHIKYLIYPVDYRISLNKPISIPESKISWSDSKIQFVPSGSFTTPDSEFTLEIPPASYVADEEDDDMKAIWPKLLKADCVSIGLGSSNDLWLAPISYHVPFNLKFSNTDNGIEVRFQPRFPPIKVNLDTCFSDGIILGTIIAAAFLIGPFEDPPYKTIDKINEYSPGVLIQKMMNDKIRETPFKFEP